MSRLRYNWEAAVNHLQCACPPLAAFIAGFGPRRYRVRSGDLFQALARSIAYQQLSGKAAATIHGRFEDLFADRRPRPAETLGLGIQRLRETGLSQAKSLSIIDLAEKSLSGSLPGTRSLSQMADDEVIASLCQVRGIGPWTAQMHMIFYLGRPDVMPATDLGVQKGVQNIYRMRKLPAPAQVLRRTRHLAPFRSAAAWYFWRASETVTP